MEKITAITNAKFDKILYNNHVTCWRDEIAVMAVRKLKETAGYFLKIPKEQRRRIRCVNIRLDRNRF